MSVRLCGLVLTAVVIAGCRGHHEGAGTITGKRLPATVVTQRQTRELEASRRLVPAPAVSQDKQILFGDLHVHTTFSADAFLRSLPLLQGEGAHPPADACDFARFCSALDFWSINDHAEAISPQHWQETKEAIRQCNAVAGDPQHPDVVAFLGWEWTQVGMDAATHYGHKNVIFHDTEEDKVPTRPVSALNDQLIGGMRRRPPLWQRLQVPLLDWPNRQRYFDFARYQTELLATPMCPDGVDTRSLPPTCHERAQTPRELFEKLSQWGFDTLVIPHGTTWGLYTPPGASWDKQLTAAQHDPDKQTLIEVFSGHGNTEEYRDWRPVNHEAGGRETCPPPSKGYVPCCWQAGELIRARCGDIPKEECERRVATAQQNFVDAGVFGHLTVIGATIEDWKNCGQCTDCFDPSFGYRPANSVQYTLAITNFDQPAQPRRFRFGFIASSDNHSARPGTGYKEFGRRFMTEAAGVRDEMWRRRMLGPEPGRPGESVRFNAATDTRQAFQQVDFERQASFFLTGGLVAVHAEGRDRDAIWTALKRREVYGTSGDRILLWFDLLNGPNGPLPMGADTQLAETPRFRVRAVGAFKQLPGCPTYATSALTPDRLQRLCRGECYNPGDERRVITRIEIIRIRPQNTPGEPVGPLIEDPWRTFTCPHDQTGCAAEFDDPDFVAGQREFIYYARAIQEPTPAVNAGGLRCTYNDQGDCVAVHPCYGDYRTPADDDCLSPNEERAWSSPIYVGVKRGT
jgi:hypothetical protein